MPTAYGRRRPIAPDGHPAPRNDLRIADDPRDQVVCLTTGMRVRHSLRLWCAGIALVLGACGASAPVDAVARPPVGILNGTPFPVTLVIDGRPIADFDGSGPRQSFDVEALPTLPWDVEARSPSGRVLSSLHVAPGDVTTATASDENRLVARRVGSDRPLLRERHHLGRRAPSDRPGTAPAAALAW